MMKRLPQRRRMRPHSILVRRGLLAVTAVVAPILACDPDASPVMLTAPRVASRSAATTEDLVSPGWQAIEANLVAQANLAAVVSTRAYSLLGVAQYLAVQRGEGSRRDGRSRDGSDAGAVAGASATVLSYLFPLRAQALQDTVKAQRGAGPGFARGEVSGRAVGAEIVARAQADGFSTPSARTIRVGAGFWVSNPAPATVAGGPLPGVRPWFLTSARQFRPGPPPAFGSRDFLAGMAEIRHISDTRTAEQIAIATFWAQGVGTRTTAGFWLQIATDGIQSHRLSERQATHLYALLSASMFDAQIGCWDAKETYWFIRPWQADPGVTVVAAVGKPNHPSYPSGHSCLSSSAGAVLSAFFPKDRKQFGAMVTEAGMSRLYGGIHYGFDIEAGQRLGRGVAGGAHRGRQTGPSAPA